MSVAIAGVAESDLGVTDKTVLQLQSQAISRALDDAGLTLSEVDGLATNAVSRFSTTQLAEYLGITPTWTESSFAGGSTYLSFIAHAAMAIQSGAAEVVVVSYGSNQRSMRARELAGPVDMRSPQAQFETPYGPLNPLSFYAMAAQRHMHEYATTPEQLAEVAVAARSWALLNPLAYRSGAGPLTVADVLASAVISSPLHALDCCLVTDGGGAVVLTSNEKARDLRRAPVVVLGHGEATTHDGMSQAPSLTVTGAAQSGERALRAAGIGIADVDVTQIYDSFTITVLLTLEALGFCASGESGAFVSGGRIAPGGDLALNTSGGGLSYCHPGQLGLLLVVEAVRQLRGECGDRQVQEAEIALCHGTGGIASHHSTLLLGIDR